MKIYNVWFNRELPLNVEFRTWQYYKFWRFVPYVFYFIQKLLPHKEFTSRLTTGTNSRSIYL